MGICYDAAQCQMILEEFNNRRHQPITDIEWTEEDGGYWTMLFDDGAEFSIRVLTAQGQQQSELLNKRLIVGSKIVDAKRMGNHWVITTDNGLVIAFNFMAELV